MGLAVREPVAFSLRIANLVLGSVMLGGLLFGAVLMPRQHARLPPREAWRFHQFVSRRVDWFLPPSVFLAMTSGLVLGVLDVEASDACRAVTFGAGAGMAALYGLPFTFHPTGARNEVMFLRIDADQLTEVEATRRMRWWDRWHYWRLGLCAIGQVLYVVAER